MKIDLSDLNKGDGMFVQMLTIGIKVAIVAVLTFVILLLAKFVINKMGKHFCRGDDPGEAQKRSETITAILWTTAKTAIIVIGVMMMISQMGINLGPILATVGVGGLAIGFGAQTVVKDVLSGFFLIIENQILVGDFVKIGDDEGWVEKITLRTLTMRNFNGNIHIIPHGSVDRVTNMTRGFSYYVFRISVSYNEDTDRVVKVLKDIGEQLRSDANFSELILEPLDVVGVDEFGDSAVVIKARIKTKPAEQWNVGREMNRRIKKVFEEQNIEMPYPHMTIVTEQPAQAVQPAGQRPERLRANPHA